MYDVHRMLFVCCVVCGVHCLLQIACCELCVACCILFGIVYYLCVVCCLLVVALVLAALWFVVCRVLSCV